MSQSSDPVASTPTHRTTVLLPANLHARPAGRIARAAAGFTSTLRLEHAGRTATPSGVLSVMALGATAGSAVTVSGEGPDAQEAVAALAAILAAAE